MNEKKYLKWYQKVAYGSGDMASNCGYPMSKAMLDACDKYGMLVMDEISDMWTVHKNPNDFALHFKECWEEVAERMVAKDYNHPSVALYSTGK